MEIGDKVVYCCQNGNGRYGLVGVVVNKLVDSDLDLQLVKIRFDSGEYHWSYHTDIEKYNADKQNARFLYDFLEDARNITNEDEADEMIKDYNSLYGTTYMKETMQLIHEDMFQDEIPEKNEFEFIKSMLEKFEKDTCQFENEKADYFEVVISVPELADILPVLDTIQSLQHRIEVRPIIAN